MVEQLIYYLTLISKLSDILKYIKTHSKDNEKDSYDLSSYIQECKTICINLVKSEPLIELFLHEIKQEQEQEIKQEQEQQEQQHNDVETIIPVPEPDTQNTQDIELKEQLDTLAILLTGAIQTSENEPMSSDTFDTLGSGLSRIFKVTDTTPTVVTIPQLKNEINNNSSNINFEIKRK
jgi:beta-lactamase superfamily II metal-dependent hydrolase